MVATAWSSSSSGQRTNWRGRSSPAAYPMRSRAVSLVWRLELTKTSTGLMGECAWKPQSQGSDCVHGSLSRLPLSRPPLMPAAIHVTLVRLSYFCCL